MGTGKTHRGVLAAGAALAAAVALFVPAAATAAPPDYLTSQSIFSGTTISLKQDRSAEILDRAVLAGRIAIPGPNRVVTVTVEREGRPVLTRQVPTDPVSGRYHVRLRLKGCCEYLARAVHGSDVSYPFAFEVRAPRTLENGRQALLFNRLLQRSGYHMGEEITAEVDEATGLGIMALRKVHDMERTEEYEPGLFALLLKGEAAFEPVHEEEGRHVEVDISRQVMALVEDGSATDVFHVSTGSGGTPRGEWTFYDKGPGYNAKGMYYSVYYDGNYATHGYSSVPTYPASHGCTRNSLQYATYVYDWIELGDTIYVYD